MWMFHGFGILSQNFSLFFLFLQTCAMLSIYIEEYYLWLLLSSSLSWWKWDKSKKCKTIESQVKMNVLCNSSKSFTKWMWQSWISRSMDIRCWTKTVIREQRITILGFLLSSISNGNGTTASQIAEINVLDAAANAMQCNADMRCCCACNGQKQNYVMLM